MNRHEIREAVFKLAFQIEFYTEEELLTQIENFFLDPVGETTPDDDIELFDISDEERNEIKDEVIDLKRNIDDIDKLINERTEGWKTGRMGKVDLTAIRLSVYEMKYKEIATGVSINEAVVLAKKYGGEKSSSFVNGVLARIVV